MSLLLFERDQLETSPAAARAGRREEPSRGLWQKVRSFWCHHSDTFRIERSDEMPAHTVCRACGWREPVSARQPAGTRTWDSSRDEARYEREKRRRETLALQKQLVVAERAVPSPMEIRPRRSRRANVIELARPIAR